MKSKDIKDFFLFNIFSSDLCVTVFFFSFVLSYFLIPTKIFYKWYILLAMTFMFVFALTITCTVRTIKERVVNAKKNGATFLSIIGAVVGLGALQTCSIGAPVCGASVTLGIVSLIFPNVAYSAITDYSLTVVIISIILQLFALYHMKCFRKIKRH